MLFLVLLLSLSSTALGLLSPTRSAARRALGGATRSCVRCAGPATAAAVAAAAAGAAGGRRSALVVGGGASGLSCALELAGRGWSVSVLSRDTSEGATRAAGGMLAPQAERLEEGPLLDLCVRARSHFPPWLQRVERLSGVDANLCSRGGFLAPAFEGDAVQRWRPPAAGGPATWLGPEALRALEPAVSEAAVGGWLFEREASVDPRALHDALLTSCGALGVRVLEGVSACSLNLDVEAAAKGAAGGSGGAAAAVITSDGAELRADAVVLACGAWARELLPLASFPIKGQMLRLRPPPGHAQREAGGLQRTLFGDGVYLIPRRDGAVVVGATEEPGAGYDRRATAGGVAQLLDKAVAAAPVLADFTLDEVWAGLRPTTPDRMPLLGRASSALNLHVAAGYHRNGILLSPLCAKLVADGIEGALTEQDAALLAHFEVERFSRVQPSPAAPPAPATSSASAPAGRHPNLLQRVAAVPRRLFGRAPPPPAAGAAAPDLTAPVGSPGGSAGGAVPGGEATDEWWNLTPRSPEEAAATAAVVADSAQREESMSRALAANRAFRDLVHEIGEPVVAQSVVPTPSTAPPPPPPPLQVPPPPPPPPPPPLQGPPPQAARAAPAPSAAAGAAKEEHAGFAFWTGESSDVGPTIDMAMAANRDFRALMQEGSVQDPLARYEGGEQQPASAEPAQADADEIRLWKIEEDGSKTPLRFGCPPPELLQGYGDTVLPPPVPEASAEGAAAAAASAPALEARASKLQRMVDELGTPANGVVAPSDGVSAPANGVAAPANGVSAPANGVVANGAAAPANGVGARANGVSQVAFAPPASEEPEWMSEQRAGIARAAAARPTTAEADAAAAESLHVNADGYTQADAAVDRDDALRAAFASNQELKLALSEGAEGALSQAVEAELADFRRQAGMD